MGFVLQVGELKQMPKSPHKFPVCGNWKYTTPAEDEDEDEEKKFPTNSTGSVHKTRSVALFMFGYLCFVMSCLL